jgi:cytochrome bd-type quinol oxidase subunit 1
MDSALFIHRLHFAFTVTYHYLFPQLTMGLAPLIVALKSLALWNKDDRYNRAARFWAKIFGINFVLGVVTGIPLEFQFGTNWSHFSQWAGGVIGQTLAMEGVFAFFLESTFLGLTGLGTIFIAIMVVSAILLWRKGLFDARWALWILMLSFPFPYIANTAGWITAEVGRQPWLVYGLLRTADGYSKMVSAGNGMFTLLGFMGMYTVLSFLFLFLIYREIDHGPADRAVKVKPPMDEPEPVEVG